MHGREALDIEKPRHVYRAEPAILGEIVAQEVDDHHVLGAILLARAQLLARAPRPARACPARGRVPLIGFVSTLPPFTEKPLGRCGQHLRVRRAQVRREWRRVQHAQRLVREPRIAAALRAEALREVDLIAVAVGDITLDVIEGLRVRSSRVVRYDR